MRSALLTVALGALLVACESESERPDGSTSRDLGVGDGGVVNEDATPADASPEDAALPSDGSTAVVATLHERCLIEERIGLVELIDDSGFFSAYATIEDRPAPWIGPPVLSDTQCSFYDTDDVCGCDVTQVCSHTGVCVDPPLPASNVRLVVRTGASEEVFTESSPGHAGGVVTLTGRSFALEAEGLGYRFSVAETELPVMLANLGGMLSGTYDMPVAVDISWLAPAGESHVFTHIPINHHVPGPTFTECAVDAQTGAMHVDQPMLTPLAVGTGLEFQGVSHIRFAAAHVPQGCVEFRFHVRHYLSLF